MNKDPNCDLGESFGQYKLGDDEAVMPFITSANIACGFHAGDPLVMRSTIRLAKKYNVAIGAHPGLPETCKVLVNVKSTFFAKETEAIVLYQIGALAGFVKAEGVELRHVKPHGAVYNQAAKDRVPATAIARAVKVFSADLILVRLAGSSLIEAGTELGLRVGMKDFRIATTTWMEHWFPASKTHAVIELPDEVVAHALTLAQNGINFSGRHVNVDTLCLHGDNVHAEDNARLIRDTLSKNKILVEAM